MKGLFVRFWTEDSGATAMEYAMIAALISIVIIAGATSLGTAVNDLINGSATKISAAGAAS